MRQGRWLAIALGLALLLPVTASGGDITIGTKASYSLSEGFAYLEDPGQTAGRGLRNRDPDPPMGRRSDLDLAVGQGRGAGRTRARHGLGDHGHH